MYISEHFRIEELVSKELFQKYSDTPEILWKLFDERLLISLDQLKEKFPKGTMTINNWLWGGDRNNSGYREYGSAYFRLTSTHANGRGADCVFSDYPAQEVRNYIKKHPEEFPLIKGLEDFEGMSWIHIDTGNRGESLKVFGK